MHAHCLSRDEQVAVKQLQNRSFASPNTLCIFSEIYKHCVQRGGVLLPGSGGRVPRVRRGVAAAAVVAVAAAAAALACGKCDSIIDYFSTLTAIRFDLIDRGNP